MVAGIPPNSTMQQQPLSVITIPYVEFFELLLDLIAPLVNVYFIWLLRRPFFHVNLRMLLAQFSIGLICLTLSRALLVLQKKVNFMPNLVNMALNIFHDGHVIGVMDVSLLISCERVMATILAKKYETLSTVWITVAAPIAIWLLNTYFGYNIYACVINKNKTRPGLITHSKEGDNIAFVMISCMALNVIGLVLFLVVRRFNEKRWKKDLRRKLSYRYQIMENIRTSKQLFNFMLLDFVISCYFFAVIFQGVFVIEKQIINNIFTQIFDLLAAVAAMGLPILFIRTHPRMWKKTKGYFPRWTKRKNVNPSRTAVVERRQEIVVKEANMYFDDLRKAWDGMARK